MVTFIPGLRSPFVAFPCSPGRPLQRPLPVVWWQVPWLHSPARLGGHCNRSGYGASGVVGPRVRPAKITRKRAYVGIPRGRLEPD